MIKSNQNHNILKKDKKPGDAHASKRQIELTLVCANIKSAHNLGNLVRSAECLGFEKIILTGYTCDYSNESFLKTSMGAELFLEFSRFETLKETMTHLKDQNYKTIGLETVDKPDRLVEIQESIKSISKLAFIVGNETKVFRLNVCHIATLSTQFQSTGEKTPLMLQMPFARQDI